MEGIVAIVFPMMIPIVALLIPIFAIYFHYKEKRDRRKERMLAIEKGVEVPPDIEPVKKPLTPIDHLRRGLISIAVGVGLIVGSYLWHIDDPEATGFFTMAGLVVLLVGIALTTYSYFQRKSQE